LVPFATLRAVPIQTLQWYRLHRYEWYRYSATVTERVYIGKYHAIQHNIFLQTMTWRFYEFN